MLGERVSDPDGVEGGGAQAGLGLLPGETVFWGEKTRTRVEGTFTGAQGVFAPLNGVTFDGYEIHMGETTSPVPPCTALHTLDGVEKADGGAMGNVLGTYVHGLFERGSCAGGLVDCLRAAKGLSPVGAAEDWAHYKERQYNALADTVRSALDMERVYRILDRKE